MNLKPPRTRVTLAGLSRLYLEFKDKHETGWEVIEGIWIALVFVLLVKGWEHESELISRASHLAVGILLVTKLLSIMMRILNSRYGDQVG